MDSDADLPTLVERGDHLNVLRYLRVHQLREPEIAIEHGRLLLGAQLNRKLGDELARLAALEQICLAAVDRQQMELAYLCLQRLKEAGITSESARLRRLQGRCMEAVGDYSGADLLYDELLKENPANLMALKRKYCVRRAQVGKQIEAVEALNDYLQQNYADTAAWAEMAALRMEMGDFRAAAFAWEEVLLGTPADPKIHCELAECYATIGGLDQLLLARKHFAQALELDPSYRRALFGLVSAANAYLISAAGKKDADEHENAVAKELGKFGAERLIAEYKGTKMVSRVVELMGEYTAEL